MGKKKKQHSTAAVKVECVRGIVGKQHINKCKEGFGFSGPEGSENQGFGSKTRNRVEVHHVFCIEAADDASIPDETDFEFLEACWDMTPWNINDAHNTLGLPRKWAYVRDKDGSLGTGWDGYACHQVDHDRYSAEVITWLEKKVWSTLERAQDEEDCEVVTGANIKTKLESCTNHFKPKLKGRKTKSAMDYCHGVAGTGFTDATWFKEFSMWPDAARPRAKIKKKFARKGLLVER